MASKFQLSLAETIVTMLATDSLRDQMIAKLILEYDAALKASDSKVAALANMLHVKQSALDDLQRRS
jgi:hypothetical protein